MVFSIIAPYSYVQIVASSYFNDENKVFGIKTTKRLIA